MLLYILECKLVVKDVIKVVGSEYVIQIYYLTTLIYVSSNVS